MKKFGITLITFILTLGLMTSCGNGITIPDEYSYDDLTKYIKLGEYKNLEYEQQDRTVTRTSIEAKIDEALDAASESKQLDSGKVTEDCTANIDYSGSVDGVKFDGGSDTDYNLDIDNSSFIEGFAEALIGHEVGSNFDINVTFPENYGKAELAGKSAVFNITVNYITVSERPEYNDAFVKKNTEFKTTEEYEKNIEQELFAEIDKTASDQEKSDIFNQIVDASEVLEYPETEFNAKKQHLTDTYKAKAENAGRSIGDYVEQELGMTEEEFNQEVKSYTETTVKMELIIHQIARLEKIEPTDKDYQEYLNKLLSDSGLTEDTFESQVGCSLAEYAEQNDLYTSMLYQKVIEKVMEYSVMK